LSFYNNPKYDSKVNDFGDEYHSEEAMISESEREVMRQIRSLKRKYRDPYEYSLAKDLYISYTENLIEKYGGKKRFARMYKFGLVSEYIPFCPELRRTKKNQWFWKYGMPLGSKIEVEFKLPPYKISKVNTVDFSYKKSKEAYLYRSDIEDDITDKIQDELKIIGEFYRGRIKSPTKLSKKAQRRRMLAQKYRKDPNEGKSITKRMEEFLDKKFYNIYDEDEEKEDAYIYYKDTIISANEAEEIEAYELLKSLGIKVSRKNLSKKSRKVVKRKKIKFGKKKKKKGKKKYMDSFTDGRYNSYEEFEREMLELTRMQMERE
jgi:hypothetical protein